MMFIKPINPDVCPYANPQMLCIDPARDCVNCPFYKR